METAIFTLSGPRRFEWYAYCRGFCFLFGHRASGRRPKPPHTFFDKLATMKSQPNKLAINRKLSSRQAQLCHFRRSLTLSLTTYSPLNFGLKNLWNALAPRKPVHAQHYAYFWRELSETNTMITITHGCNATGSHFCLVESSIVKIFIFPCNIWYHLKMSSDLRETAQKYSFPLI